MNNAAAAISHRMGEHRTPLGPVVGENSLRTGAGSRSGPAPRPGTAGPAIRRRRHAARRCGYSRCDFVHRRPTWEAERTLMAHPAVLKDLIAQYETLTLLGAGKSTPQARQRLADISYTL